MNWIDSGQSYRIVDLHVVTLVSLGSASDDNDVTGVEFDVWLSSDGFPVCHHDLSVDRTTNGTGLITDKPLAEILALDAGSWFGSGEYTGTPVPRFEEGRNHVVR